MIIQSPKTTNIVMASNRAMSKSLPRNVYINLFLIPLLMGLGHLAPAIGAIRVATGTYQFPIALFGMIATGAAPVDCKSKTKKVPMKAVSYLGSNHFLLLG